MKGSPIPYVENIYITSVGGSAMQPVEQVLAVQGEGLQGDRYMMRTGYWTGVDECQVTFIEGEALDEIQTATNVQVSNGEHRRNIVTRALSLGDLWEARFKVGDALLEFDRPRPPCRYIQSTSERGMTKALGRARGGICARVLESGIVRVRDSIEIVERVAPGDRPALWRNR